MKLQDKREALWFRQLPRYMGSERAASRNYKEKSRPRRETCRYVCIVRRYVDRSAERLFSGCARTRRVCTHAQHGVLPPPGCPRSTPLRTTTKSPSVDCSADRFFQVVCGRGGSATTRYVDLVVGLEADDGEGGTAVTQQEFSNIDREALPCLQV